MIEPRLREAQSVSGSGRTSCSNSRNSLNAARPDAAIVRNASRASAGRASNPSSAAVACTTIIETVCATTSWSSRAIRARSSTTA